MSLRYSVCHLGNVVQVMDDIACRVVDTFTSEQEDAARVYVQDLNNAQAIRDARRAAS